MSSPRAPEIFRLEGEEMLRLHTLALDVLAECDPKPIIAWDLDHTVISIRFLACSFIDFLVFLSALALQLF